MTRRSTVALVAGLALAAFAAASWIVVAMLKRRPPIDAPRC